jgi:GTP-binding protein
VPEPAASPTAALPRIVIVGRPNVGKSSLLNLLAGRSISIVDPTAGVTRDRVEAAIGIPADTPGQPDHPALLIDTGGYGIEDADRLTEQVETQIARGLAQADVVLFVLDAQQGPVALDRTVADVLRKTIGTGKSAKPLIVVANKVDADNHEAGAYELAELGLGVPVPLSAKTGHNRHALYRAIREAVDLPHLAEVRKAVAGGEDDARDEGIKLALVGKRNAGKSTLVNAIAGEDRVIVSETAGTTRDSVDVRIDRGGQRFTLIDTAGVRKRKSLASDIEYYSQHRSLRSVRRADVCVLLVDAAVPISQVDHQLMGEITRHFRPTVIAVNKWDLAESGHTVEQYGEYLEKELRGLDFAPVVFTSARDGEGLDELLEVAADLYHQSRQRVTTSEVNNLVQAALLARPPSSKLGKRAKVLYATQVSVDPPTLALFVNDPDLFDPGYQRYLMNRLREAVPYAEVPIKLLLRDRRREAQEARE